MGRIGKKIKAGLKLGAKIGAGVIGTAGVVGAGLFALGSKASPSVGMNDVDRVTDFMSGRGSIANVSTADLDKLYQPKLPQGSIANISTADLDTLYQPRPRPTTKPRIKQTSGIGSGLTQAQKDRDLALIKLLEADGV